MDRRNRGHRSAFSAVINDDSVLLDDLFARADPVGSVPTKDTQLLVSDRNDAGQTALHIAASNGSFRCMTQLIAKGSNVHDRDLENGQNALHIACTKGHLGSAMLLLGAGAQLDDSHESALLRMRPDLSRWASRVLRIPASAGNRDKEGFTPSDLLAQSIEPAFRCLHADINRKRAALAAMTSRGTRRVASPDVAQRHGASSSSGEEVGGGTGTPAELGTPAPPHDCASHTPRIGGASPSPGSGSGGRNARRNKRRGDSFASGSSRRSRGTTFDETVTSGDGEFLPGLFAQYAALQVDGGGDPALSGSSLEQTRGSSPCTGGCDLDLDPPTLAHPPPTDPRGLDWGAILDGRDEEEEEGGPPIAHPEQGVAGAGGRGRGFRPERLRSVSDAPGRVAARVRFLMSDDPYASALPAVVVTPTVTNMDPTQNGEGNTGGPSWRCGVYTWGKSDYQLGYSTGTDAQLFPRALDIGDAGSDDGRVGSGSLGSSDCIIVAASAGRYHTLLLTHEGVPLVFGVGQGGRTGITCRGNARPAVYDDGFVQMCPIPIPFFAQSRLVVSSVSAGERHSLAVCSNGALYAWGDNRAGACGGGTAPGQGSSGVESGAPAPLTGVPVGIIPVPRRVEGALRRSRVKSAVAGPYHSIALLSDGTAWAWGSNWTGQLGIRDVPSGGTSSLTVRPPQIQAPAGQHAISPPHIVWYPRKMDALPLSASCGGGSSGSNVFSALLGGGSGGGDAGRASCLIVAAAAADAYSLLLTSDGDVFTCGSGTSAWIRLVMDAAEADTEDAVAAYLESAAAIAGSSKAEVSSSGPGSSSAGSSQSKGQGTPVKAKRTDADSAIASTSGTNTVQVYSRAGREAGEDLARFGFHVVALGTAESSMAGKGASSTPIAAADASSTMWMTTFSPGKGKSKGALQALQASASSSLAMGSLPGSPASSTTPASAFAVLAASRGTATRPACVASISAAKHHAVAVDGEGRVWTWGCRAGLLGHTGQGQGAPSSSPSAVLQWSAPRRVSALARANIRIVRASASNLHTLCVGDDGRLYSWGDSIAAERGTLGHGKGVQALLPRRVAAIQQVVDVSAGESHSVVVGAVFLPPLPPTRPSAHDLASCMLREGMNVTPRVELPGAMAECGGNERAAISLRIYGPVVREEVMAARQLADVYRDMGVAVNDHDEGPEGNYSSVMHSSDMQNDGSGTPPRVTLVAPSLRSLCERTLASGIGVGSAAGMLAIAEDYNAPGLAAYCGSILAANMPATLAYMTVGKGRSKDRDILLAHGDGLQRWRWMPPRALAGQRAREATAHRHLVMWYKAVKKREYELMRPTASRRSAPRAGAEPILSGHVVPKKLEAVLAEDCTRIRKLLFSGALHAAVEGDEEDEEVRGAGCAPLVSPPSPTVRARQRLPSDLSTGAQEAAVRQRDGSISEICLSFQGAYDAILAARHGPVVAQDGVSRAIGDGVQMRHDDEEDEDAHASHQRMQRAKQRKGLGRGGRSAEAAHALLPVLPRCLATTLPQTAPPATQSSLDRLAANLIELQCGPGMCGPSLSPVLAEAGPRITIETARGLVTQVMLTDAVAILKRVKAQRKKLLEATALAVQACGITPGEDGTDSVVATGHSRLPPLDSEQKGKLSRRLEMAAEIFTVDPFLRALSDLLRWVHRAVRHGEGRASPGGDKEEARASTSVLTGSDSGGDSHAQALSALLSRLEEVAQDATATSASISSLTAVGLSPSNLLRGSPMACASAAAVGGGGPSAFPSAAELHAAVHATAMGAGSSADVDTVRAVLSAAGSASYFDRSALERLVLETVVGAAAYVGEAARESRARKKVTVHAPSSAQAARPGWEEAKVGTSATASAWAVAETGSASPCAKVGTPLPAVGRGSSTGPVQVHSLALEASLWDMIEEESKAAAAPPPRRPAPIATPPSPGPNLAPSPPPPPPRMGGLKDILAAEEKTARARADAANKARQEKVAAHVSATKAEEAASAVEAAKVARLKAAFVPFVPPASAARASGGSGLKGAPPPPKSMAEIRREQEEEQERMQARRGTTSMRSPFAERAAPLDLTRNAWGLAAAVRSAGAAPVYVVPGSSPVDAREGAHAARMAETERKGRAGQSQR